MIREEFGGLLESPDGNDGGEDGTEDGKHGDDEIEPRLIRPVLAVPLPLRSVMLGHESDELRLQSFFAMVVHVIDEGIDGGCKRCHFSSQLSDFRAWNVAFP